jgi:hypothetical protein
MRFTNRKFGVEIEVVSADVSRMEIARLINAAGVACQAEGYNHTRRSHWKVVTDSSLNGSRGFEVVSPPLSGADGAIQLQKVCQVLNDANAKVDRSCGLHVHHDANDFDRQGMKNVLAFYAKFEKAIDWLMPKSRRGDTAFYSRTMVAFGSVERSVRTIHNAPGNAWSQFNNAAARRYHKVNLESFTRHGTIEFRQHSGTVDYKKIIAWVVFTQAVVEYARRNKVRATGQVTLSKLFITLGWYDKNGRDEITKKSVYFLSSRFNHFTGQAGVAITNKTDLR